MTKIGLTIMALLVFASTSVHAQYDHQPWQDLLMSNVVLINDGKSSQVDYQGFADQRDQLQKYLKGLSSVPLNEFNGWNRDEQLAFLINAYNAWTVDYVLTLWPKIESIKELGNFFSSPWRKDFIPLFNDVYSLDDIEHGMIRGNGKVKGFAGYQDPRIHFAVNCASVGCPALSNRAYSGALLEAQLEAQTRLFLMDKTRNRYDQGEGTLMVSPIFHWYKRDFQQGWIGYDRLEQFFADYSDELGMSKAQARRLRSGELEVDIDFLQYDWDLNVVR